jgi:hypothetical protein
MKFKFISNRFFFQIFEVSRGLLRFWLVTLDKAAGFDIIVDLARRLSKVKDEELVYHTVLLGYFGNTKWHAI